MKTMSFEKQHLRHCLLFAFQLKKNVAEAQEMICSALGENSVSYSTCKKWFQRFHDGNFNLEDEEYLDQPKKVKTEELEQCLNENSCQTQSKLAIYNLNYTIFDYYNSIVNRNLGNVQGTVQGTVQGQQLVQRERQNIWQGILEWIEKAKNPTDTQKQTRHVPCQVSANSKDGDPELKADTWPPKLIMQLMPKQLIGNIGSSYLKNSKSVIFHPTPCEALESLTKMMSAGFAGCVHFTSVPPSPACEIKVLILLYTAEKKSYLGFIPNDQTAFVDSLRKVIQQQKTSHASMRQGQGNPGPGNTIPAPMPTTGTQGGILMSQTNTMAMGGGQITQNVISSNASPQTLNSTVPQTQMNMQNTGISGPQANAGAGGMITQQRPPFDDLELARHQNLLKIQQLRQTLEAAQQQEAQYKSQLEVNIQQNLEVAQQQEMQYKQQLEAQQAQRGLNPAAMANQQANTQRMMRPVTTNNLGLRHLLQQPQSQYRQQVFGVQQQMVGPRGQITARPMAPGNAQNQQFEDVPNYDFLN